MRSRLNESGARMTPFIGILMLDTAFPRVPGDAGNMDSYGFPTRIRTVPGAGALDVVQNDRPHADLLGGFIDAAQALERDGAVGLVSTCGFLVHFQREIADAVRIPVMVSALSLYPSLRLAFGGAPIGILTASTAALIPGGLNAAGIYPSEVAVAGFDACPAFTSAILADKADQPDTLDMDAIEQHAIASARALVRQHPDLGCILLECGNLPPYTNAIAASIGRPVYSILDVAHMLWSGANPPRFPSP